MKKQHIFLIFFTAIALIACNSNHSKEDSKETTVTEGVVNTDSEMTLLMREMHDNFAIVRDSIMQGKNIDRSLFSEIHRTHRATPTDSTIMGAPFEAMATSFLVNVDSLLLSEENKEMYFNISVQSCIGCHQAFCPGPVDKIKKLFIEPIREKQ